MGPVITFGPLGSHHVLSTAVHAARLGRPCFAVLVPQPMNDHHRLVHHRSANTAMVYERSPDGSERRLGTAEGREVSELLRAKLEHWESEQLSRIQCRLGVRANAEDPVRR